MFIGDYREDATWSTDSLRGCKRFLDRVIKLGERLNDKAGYTDEVLINKTIKKVTNDLLNLKYNTAVAALMTMINELEKHESITKDDYRVLLVLLNPIAPHNTEELNEKYSLGEVICKSSWPEYDEEKTIDKTKTIGVQVNGKLRGEITINLDEDEKAVEEKAKNLDNVKKFTEGKEIVKVINIKGKIVNIVVK